MREHTVERPGSRAELLAEVSNDLGELADREREDVVPLERELRKLRLRLERDARDGVERKRHARSAGAHDEVLPLPVRSEYRVRGGLRGCDSRRLVVAQDNRARAVSEEDARRAVGPVEDARQALRADDERLLVGVEVDESARLLERVDEPRARRLQVEGARVDASEHVLHDAGRGWERGVVGRGGREDDEPYLLGRDLCHLERGLGGLSAHRGRGLAVFGNVPGVDARVRINPLVARVESGGNVVVRDDLRRQVAAGSKYANAHNFPLSGFEMTIIAKIRAARYGRSGADA